MGTVTVVNRTNVLINSTISAGVNYSWCNRLSPRTYYVHEGLAGVYTLHTRYWMGAASEFSHNIDEIGLFVGAIALGIVGLVLVPFGGGYLLGAAGFLSAAGGMGVTGMALGVKDFRSTAADWTNIHALENRVFVADAQVTLSQSEGVVKWENVPDIQLSEISQAEFRKLVADGYVEHQHHKGDEDLIVADHLTAAELRTAGLLEVPLRIFPSLGGNACWEIENDSTADSARMQLWERNVPNVQWRIEPVGDDSTTNFRIHNPALDRYVKGTDTTAQGSDMVFAKSKQYLDQFNTGLYHVVKSTIERVEGKPEDFYAFIRVKNLHDAVTPELTIVPESGNLGNSTKLVMRKLNDGRPSWARWRLDKSPVPAPK
jgi:hypothetical protein